MQDYIDSGVWPAKSMWKRLVVQAVTAFCSVSELHEADSDCVPLTKTFRELQNSTGPHIFWVIARTVPEARRAVYNFARLCTVRGLPASCKLCSVEAADQVDHFMLDCPAKRATRERFWATMTELPEPVLQHLRDLPDQEL